MEMEILLQLRTGISTKVEGRDEIKIIPLTVTVPYYKTMMSIRRFEFWFYQTRANALPSTISHDVRYLLHLTIINSYQQEEYMV